MRAAIDTKFFKNIRALKESSDLNHHMGERFNFSVKCLSLVARGIANHLLEINERFVYANIGTVDYFLQILRDNTTCRDALVLSSEYQSKVDVLDGKPCNLIMINHEHHNSSEVIKDFTLYKAEDSTIEFFHTHLDIFLQELERMTITHMLRIGAGASFLGNSIHMLKGCKYSGRLNPL